MTHQLKVASWNVCLGLTNKKDFIIHEIRKEQIDICCLQECEVSCTLDENTLSFRDYSIELEENTYKKRTGIYINNRVSYNRRKDLESQNCNIVIIDISEDRDYRIINVYRSFSTYNNERPIDKFQNQLMIIQRAILESPSKIPIIVGDFNLDYNKAYNHDYQFKGYFDLLNETFEPLNICQLVHFETWSRFVNKIKRFSIIDHVYTNTPEIITDICPNATDIGDHVIVTFLIECQTKNQSPVMKRDWRFYSKEKLIRKLNDVTFVTNLDDVQQTWNLFENCLIEIIDDIVPLTPFINDSVVGSTISPAIKSLINKKKQILKRKKSATNFNEHVKLREISKEIKRLVQNNKTNNVRRSILPGNSKSLWTAVKKAKDLNITQLPRNLTLNSIEIPSRDLPDSFAEFFSTKVQNIANECVINQNVYNGTQKINSLPENFMTQEYVYSAIKSLKIKNCEGFDRIPVRILCDSINEITPVLSHLFSLIYKHKEIQKQWRISKIIPLLKKGNPTKIENYRPIANLCSTSKIFEKLILMRLSQLEILNNVTLTGKPQHGFKKSHSTATLGLTLQSLIATALDNNDFALMASLDLSAAFDVVNTELLCKRLGIIGIPADVVSLIRLWLTDRLIYVSVNGSNSYMITSNSGTIQGSLLGPILYAIFVSPLFDIEKLSNYADDNYVIRWHSDMAVLINDMKNSLEAITKWLKDSGLKVNESKTEMCMFHRNQTKIVTLTLNDAIIRSTPQIKVLGIIFDSKLQWKEQISNAIKKSDRALQAIKIIKKYFTPSEIKTLLTANYYSILYYNSEIWHLPNLSPYLRNLLLSKSANALKLCTPTYNLSMSHLKLHEINQRATPENYCLYKHAILLHTIYNEKRPNLEWLAINFNQNFNQRKTTFAAFDNSNYKIGKNNKISNRISCLNNKIELGWLNKDVNCYKLLCKGMFLPNVLNNQRT